MDNNKIQEKNLSLGHFCFIQQNLTKVNHWFTPFISTTSNQRWDLRWLKMLLFFLMARPIRRSCKKPKYQPYESAKKIAQTTRLLLVMLNLLQPLFLICRKKEKYLKSSMIYTLVSKECNFTICGFAISLGSLSIQVNGTSTSLSA